MITTAPNLETLFDVETAIEDGWKKLLAFEDIKGFTQRDVADLPNDRVDIQLRLGGLTGHRHPDRTGQHWLDAWNAQLALQITTSRFDADGKPLPPDTLDDKHNRFRARIRILAQYASGQLTEALLPFHTMTKIQESGTAPSVQTGDDCDVSQLTFDCLISIRSGAWPAL